MLSRHIYAPRMIGAADEFVWHEVFEFPEADGRVESTVWRTVLPRDEAVHDIGCAKQADAREKGRLATIYRGFISAMAGDIRRCTTSRGHGFDVAHAPSEGDWHVHVRVRLAQGVAKPSKADKSDLRAALADVFGPLQAHRCAG